MGSLSSESPDPPWTAAHDASDSSPTSSFFTIDLSNDPYIIHQNSFYLKMQANFDKLLAMLAQIQHQQEENTKKLKDLVLLYNDRNDNAMQPPPPPTASRYHFASAAIAHMKMGGPVPWLGHDVPCAPSFLCPDLLLHEFHNVTGVYSCSASTLHLLQPQHPFCSGHLPVCALRPPPAPDPHAKYHPIPASDFVKPSQQMLSDGPIYQHVLTSSWPPPDPDSDSTLLLKSIPLKTNPFDGSFASVHLAMDMLSCPPPDPDPRSTHCRATTEIEHGFLLKTCLCSAFWKHAANLTRHRNCHLFTSGTSFLWPPPVPNWL
uniref:Uncharacterized protein n=1 Tax=Ditylum brightwellii TaxID=49249 RepID=A0A7S2EBS1_9STRA|mmetsp:Transcript_23505/g.35083  ORF Transcript_23505/g.35083 Transcript_23505/m.35083 type:complete len:318 (+) Transcript_23505:395-1348(+)